MSKRTSGLGRGLGDLLADNAPELRSGATVIRRDEGGEVTITPNAADAIEKTEEISAASIDADEIAEISEQGSDKNETSDASEASDRVIVITPSSSSNELAKNVDKRPDSAEEPKTIGTSESGETVHHPHRSLKALFRSYK